MAAQDEAGSVVKLLPTDAQCRVSAECTCPMGSADATSHLPTCELRKEYYRQVTAAHEAAYADPLELECQWMGKGKARRKKRGGLDSTKSGES